MKDDLEEAAKDLYGEPTIFEYEQEVDMEEIKAKVKEWERTKSICIAGDTMELLSKYFKEEDEEAN